MVFGIWGYWVIDGYTSILISGKVRKTFLINPPLKYSVAKVQCYIAFVPTSFVPLIILSLLRKTMAITFAFIWKLYALKCLLPCRRTAFIIEKSNISNTRYELLQYLLQEFSTKDGKRWKGSALFSIRGRTLFYDLRRINTKSEQDHRNRFNSKMLLCNQLVT